MEIDDILEKRSRLLEDINKLWKSIEVATERHAAEAQLALLKTEVEAEVSLLEIEKSLLEQALRELAKEQK